MTRRREPGRALRGLAALVGAAIVAAPLIVAPRLAVGAETGIVEGTVRASPLIVTLSLAGDSVQVGQTVKAEARIENIGPLPLQGIVVELRADQAGLLIRAPVVDIGQVRPGKSKTVSWSICGQELGSYVLLARVSATGWSIDSPARLLAVVPGRRQACR